MDRSQNSQQVADSCECALRWVYTVPARARIEGKSPQAGAILARLSLVGWGAQRRGSLRWTLEIKPEPSGGNPNIVEPGQSADISEDAWQVDPENGFVHVDAPGVLKATGRIGPDGIRWIYARSPIIDRLGLPGGTCEFAR